MKKKKGFLQKPGEKKCKFCRKPYEYQYRIVYGPDGKPIACYHDGEFHSDNLRFTRHEKKIIEKLPNGKVMVKGSDGVSRICDVVPKNAKPKSK